MFLLFLFAEIPLEQSLTGLAVPGLAALAVSCKVFRRTSGFRACLAWPVLRDCAGFYISCADSIAALGMRSYAAGLDGDPVVVSGESGAAGAGFAVTLMTRADLASFKEELGIDENSVILCFSTEGDTDKKNYRDIVWDGKYPSFE